MLRGALAFIGLAVAALVGGQLALPRLAERRITSDLSKSGHVTHVSVEAVPAIKLLFKRADRVEVEMSEVRAGTTGKLAKLLRRTGETKELKASAKLVTLGPLRVHDASLTKHHDELSGQATVTRRSSPRRCPPSSACTRSRIPRASCARGLGRPDHRPRASDRPRRRVDRRARGPARRPRLAHGVQGQQRAGDGRRRTPGPKGITITASGTLAD